MTTTTRYFLTLALVTTAACGSKKESAPADQPAAKAAEVKAAEPAPAPAPTGGTTWLKLTAYKLQLEVPEGSTAEDQSVGNFKKMGITAGTAMMTVGVVDGDMKMTFDQAVSGMASGGMKVSTKDKLPDGYHVEGATDSGMFQINIHRTINGTEYDCGTLAPDADTAKIVRSACLSIKAL